MEQTLLQKFSRAPFYGVKHVQTHLYKLIAKKESFVITVHGKPKMYAVPYHDFLDFFVVKKQVSK